MEHANEMRKITESCNTAQQKTFNDYIIALCDNICSSMTKDASKGSDHTIVHIREDKLAEAVANRFEKFGYKVVIEHTDKNNLITISW